MCWPPRTAPIWPPRPPPQGKPVFILKMEGDSLKFRLFHEDLERLGAARPFGGSLYDWQYEPLVETDHAANEVIRMFDARVPS